MTNTRRNKYCALHRLRGLDRDSGLVAIAIAIAFDERNAAVKALLSQAIQACRAAKNISASAAKGHRIIRIWRSG